MSRTSKTRRRETPRATPARPSAPPAPLVDAPPAVTRVEVKRTTSSLAALIPFVLVSLVLAWRGARGGHSAPPPSEVPAPSGPSVVVGGAASGEIEARPVELRLPAVYVRAAECFDVQEAWTFKGRDLASMTAFARGAGMPERAVDRMRSVARCDAEGCAVMPDAELIASMGFEARSALYGELFRFPENRVVAFPATRPGALGRWGDLDDVSPRVRDLIERATWRVHGNWAFSDPTWLCAQLTSDAEKAEAIATIHRRYGLDARLRVPVSGDVEPMVRYWSRGNDADEVRRVLLDARAQGGLAKVSDLLPAMARARLNRFPSPDDVEYDCFWTAINFFEGVTPTNWFPGTEGIAPLLRANYVEIPMADVILGDLIALYSADGRVTHIVNEVAGDVVFTKNGRSRTRPWVLMRLADVRDLYRFTSARAYRLR